MLYKDAGVNLDKAARVVDIARRYSDRIGGFGGVFDISSIKDFRNPVLVSSTDGVGTKIKLAIEADYLEPIGIDLVAMCVNDILTLGATPLFFLDYFATGKIDEKVFSEVLKGIKKGLDISGGILLGGETAELPGMISEEIFDVAGFVVGIVEKEHIPDKDRIESGDVILGLPSSGIHSNGYSLVRKIIQDARIDIFRDYGSGKPLYLELLTPTRIYVPEVKKLIGKYEIKGMAHITGGGLVENIQRVLPEGTEPDIDWSSWEIPWIFKKLQEWGNVPEHEMRRVFNLGIGYVVITSAPDEIIGVVPEFKVIGRVKK